jgi:hypothetical protein
MNFYKKVIKNQNTRFKILNFFKFIPDKEMIGLQYRIKTGRRLNLSNPKRYTEKLQWYKLYYRNPLMTVCADKYRVRHYVESKGLNYILNDLYGVFESFDEIDFERLPNKFVIKTVNGSGTNLFCKDKSKFDLNHAKKCIDDFFMRSGTSAGREWCYNDIPKKIIVEKYLEDETKKDKSIDDYKFICFNGVAKYVVLDIDRFTDHKRNIYDVNWNYLGINSDCLSFGDIIEKPEGFEEMVSVANTLAKGFPTVRVDLYWVNNKVYFGEMTFYPWSGYVKFDPDNFDYILGEQFKLPDKSYEL